MFNEQGEGFVANVRRNDGGIQVAKSAVHGTATMEVACDSMLSTEQIKSLLSFLTAHSQQIFDRWRS